MSSHDDGFKPLSDVENKALSGGFRNKKDERGILIRNKARLVAQGYTQEEGIDYDEVFASVARIEIKEEVYGCSTHQRFEELAFLDRADFLDRVYKVEKRGKIDKTLFIRIDKGDILLVQVYVGDIFLSSTKKSLCIEFEKMMHKKFQISLMGELTFFLGPQVKQKEDEIFISQDKYVTKILKKFSFIDVKTINTPIETQKPLLKDEDGEKVDVYMYRSMIGSLMYLTTSRADIMFAVCQPKLGLWYPKDSPFDLVAYTDSDYAGASLVRKSTTGVLLVILSTAKLILQSDLVSKRIERNGELKNRKRDRVFGMELELMKVNATRHNLLLLVEVNAARHNLLLLLEVNAARHNLLLLLKVNAARQKLTTAVES
ncbi:putative ribonuclease H-like domain-containing protein [Tanacetum coccineum]